MRERIAELFCQRFCIKWYAECFAYQVRLPLACLRWLPIMRLYFICAKRIYVAVPHGRDLLIAQASMTAAAWLRLTLRQ
jgi:hypothetical protein